MTRAMVINRRRTGLKVTSLGLRCDAKEIPEFLSGNKPAGWWLIAGTVFDGQAQANSDTTLSTVKLAGTSAVVVGDGHFAGIVSSNNTDPAIWWSWPLADLHIESVGQQGLLKKRPTDIAIKTIDGLLRLTEVSRLYRHSGNFQTGQENSLLKALGSHS